MADDGGFTRVEDPTGGFRRAAPSDTGGFTKVVGASAMSPPISWSKLLGIAAQEPGRIVEGLVETAKMPGRAASGELSPQPQTPGVLTEEDAFRQNQAQSAATRGGMDLATAFGLRLNKLPTTGRTAGVTPQGVGDIPKEAPTSPQPVSDASFPGTTRFYSGGDPYDSGPRWVTPDRKYAEGYATRDGRKGAQVYWVDIKNDNPLLRKAYDDTGTSSPAPFVSFEAPPEIARTMKPVGEIPSQSEGPIGPRALEAEKASLRHNVPGMRTLEEIFSPDTVSAQGKDAASIVRAATGRAARDEMTTQRVFEPYARTVNAMSPMGHLDLLDYMEGRPRAKAPSDPAMRAFADDFKGEMDIRRRKLESMPSTEQAKFVDDYVTHFWKDPVKAEVFFGAGKQGSGKFLKERTIGSISDGVRAGLDPVTTNPIEIGLRYVANADRFIALNEMLDTGRQTGAVKYFNPAKIPDGWTQLEGRLGRKADQVAAAPTDWARIYNNYISQGAHASPEYGRAYDTLRHGTNAVTSLELGLSGYHTLTMGQEAMVTQLAKGIKSLRGGQLSEGIKDLVKVPTAPITMAMRGNKLRDVYLGRTPGSAETRQIADLLTEAGGRGSGYKHSPDYEFSGAGSYFTAFKRGLLRAQLKEDAKSIATSPLAGPAKVMAKNVGRIMDTVAQPLFEKLVPSLKNGANFERMKQWLDQNPMATQEQKVAEARKIVDSTDNRFGEMIQDNVFWNKGLKQAAMLAMRSWSWTVGGVVREIGGGLRDVAKAPFTRQWTDKMDYVIALPLIYVAQSMVVQYLMTGKPPEGMQDLLGPRTGGVDARNGQPERLLMPGYMKDVFGFYEHPVDEAKNKIGTAPRMVTELLSNRNWRDDPIASPKDQGESWLAHVPTWMKDYFNYITENLGPISLRNIAKGQKTGSNVGPIGTALGVRPASSYITDPQGYEDMMTKLKGRKWKDKLRHDERAKQLYQGPE